MLFILTLSPNLNPPTHTCVSQVHYKKGHHERKAKYTSLADPPEVELARKADQQRSDVSRFQITLVEFLTTRVIYRHDHESSVLAD